MSLKTVSAKDGRQGMIGTDSNPTGITGDYADTAKRTVAIRRLQGLPVEEISIDEVVCLYLAQMDADPNLRPSTKTAYRTDIKQFVQFMRDIDVHLISRIDLAELDAWQSSMIQMAVATRRRKIASVSALFEWSRRQRILAVNPIEMMDRPRKVRTDVPVVSLEDFRKLMAVCQTPNERGLLGVLFYAGLRRSEAAALTVGAIDIDGREMHVVGKGGHERRVPIVGDLTPILDGLLRLRGTANAEEPLFLNQWCRALTPANVNRWFKRWVKRAGLQAKKYTPHSCRHGLGSLLGAEGVSALAISAILGHSDPKTTDRYVHQSAKQLRRHMDQVAVLGTPPTEERSSDEDKPAIIGMMKDVLEETREIMEALKRMEAA